MALAVADASVVVKWFAPEKHSDVAILLRDDFVDGRVQITAPTLLPYELMNAVRYTYRHPPAMLKRIAHAFDSLALPLRALSGPYYQRAAEVACANDITIYDASYVALALLTPGSTLWTADDRLLRKLDPSVPAKHIRDYAAGSRAVEERETTPAP